MLTDTAIKRLQPNPNQPANKPRKVSDGHGLQVWIRNTGTKSLVSVYSRNGKKEYITLGKYPALSLAQARIENFKIREMLAQGINPKEHITKERAKAQGKHAFDVYATHWVDSCKPSISPKHYRKISHAYRDHIKPFIGHKDIFSLRLSDIMPIHDNLVKQNKTCTAKNAIGWVSAIFEHAIVALDLDGLINPIPRGIYKKLVEHKTKHYPRIKITELPKLLNDIDSSGIDWITQQAFYLMTYTFVRTGELIGMRWKEIDFDNALWHIPAHRMKMKLPHIVPLAPQAIAILKEIKKLGWSQEYVFYSHRSKKTNTLSNNTLTKALHRMGYKDKMTGHGFRGLASTSLYQMQYNPKAIELQLAHVVGNKVERAYNEADMLPMRIQMMNDWANIIHEIKQGSFDTYNKRTTTDQNNISLEIFLKSLGMNKDEVASELAINLAELSEIKAMQ